MAEIIHLNYLLLPVISRFGIKLGFGDKTVAEVCIASNVNEDFFIEIINAFNDPDYYSQQDLQQFPIELTIDYLSKTHKWYLEKKVPEIENQMGRMVEECYSQKDNMKLLESFFQKYKKELINHIKHEEDLVHPYIIELSNSLKAKTISKSFYLKIRKYSINNFLKEHDDMEEKLFDLKNILIKYLPAPKNSILCNNVITELFKLEKDLNDHSRIEEKILVPRVQNMENILNKLINSEKIHII
ncbi:MAG: hemerythrin domain-containing protein [Bacteroidales bacterium]|nr:hemerythrin domain-containing protein [Bacteroidales bacterium]